MTRLPPGRLHRQRAPIFVVLAASLVAGCTWDPKPPSDVHLSPLEEKGYQVFLRERCFYSCHAVGATFVASHDVVLPNTGQGFKVYPPDLRTTPRRRADWYRAYLINPQAVLPRSSMPPFGHLPSEEIEALIALLQRVNEGVAPPTPVSISVDDIPKTHRDLAAYRAGASIYRNHCIGCHGESGNGSGPVGHLLSPEPRDFTDGAWMSKQAEAYLFAVITNGKPNTAMPAFSDTLNPEERALVLRYIEYFADPVSRERMELGFILVQNP